MQNLTSADLSALVSGSDSKNGCLRVIWHWTRFLKKILLVVMLLWSLDFAWLKSHIYTAFTVISNYTLFMFKNAFVEKKIHKAWGAIPMFAFPRDTHIVLVSKDTPTEEKTIWWRWLMMDARMDDEVTWQESMQALFLGMWCAVCDVQSSPCAGCTLKNLPSMVPIQDQMKADDWIAELEGFSL